jgi:hypothetical protein
VAPGLNFSPKRRTVGAYPIQESSRAHALVPREYGRSVPLTLHAHLPRRYLLLRKGLITKTELVNAVGEMKQRKDWGGAAREPLVLGGGVKSGCCGGGNWRRILGLLGSY